MHTLLYRLIGSLTSCARTTILSAVLIGCAVPRSYMESPVGRRVVGGVEQPFSSRQELLISGLVDEGIGLSQQSRYPSAETRLRQALYLAPENELIELDLALVLTQTDQLEEADQILTKLHDKQPINPDVGTALAGVKHALGDSEQAIVLLKEVFERLRAAKNFGRAATVARAISNVSLAIGDEQRALCYSYEALQLARTPEQLGPHALMLLGQNLFTQANDLIENAAKEAQGLVNTPLVKHALALSRYGLGRYQDALSAENDALDLVAKQPDLGAELNTTWWLMKQKVPPPRG